jgi:hypothetical protein
MITPTKFTQLMAQMQIQQAGPVSSVAQADLRARSNTELRLRAPRSYAEVNAPCHQIVKPYAWLMLYQERPPPARAQEQGNPPLKSPETKRAQDP